MIITDEMIEESWKIFQNRIVKDDFPPTMNNKLVRIVGDAFDDVIGYLCKQTRHLSTFASQKETNSSFIQDCSDTLCGFNEKKRCIKKPIGYIMCNRRQS